MVVKLMILLMKGNGLKCNVLGKSLRMTKMVVVVVMVH